MPQRILAIEIDGDRVRAATADRTWNTFQFIGVFETHRVEGEEDLAPALRRLTEKAGRPDIVISALPTEAVAKRLLELPFRDLRRLHQVVPFALEEHLPFPVDGAAVTFVRVGRTGDHSLVVAAVARKPEVQNHLKLLATAGLDPKTVTITPFAVASLFARSKNGKQPTAHLVVDAEQGSTSFVLVDKQGIPRAMRSVAFGLLSPQNTPRPADEIAPIVNALRQTMLAHTADLDGAELIVTGRGATIPKLRSNLAEALAMEARDFECSSLFDGAKAELIGYVNPIAMLLGEMPDQPVELLNFRQGEFAFRGRTRGDLTAFYTTGLLGAGLLGVILLHLSLGLYGKIHRLHLIDRQIAHIAAPVLGPDISSDPIGQLRSGISAMDKQLRILGGNMSRNSALDTLMTVSQAIPPRIPAEIEDLQVDPTGLRITGVADNFGTVDQVKRALDQSDDFDSIEVTHANSSNEANKVDFRLSADFKGAEGAR